MKKKILKNISDNIDESANYTPIIPLKDMVILPNMITPLFIGREKSINSLEIASKNNKIVILLCQKDTDDTDISIDNLHNIGTLAKIMQVLKLPDGTIKVLVEGIVRAKAIKKYDFAKFLAADIEEMTTIQDIKNIELEAIKREIIFKFKEYTELRNRIPEEILSLLNKVDSAEQLCDFLITQIVSDLNIRQEFLEIQSLKKRLNRLLLELNREIGILNVEKRIQGRVKQQIEKNQKDYYLHEQAKAIQQELGDEDLNDFELLVQKIKKAKMPLEAEVKAHNEIKKLKLMPPVSSDSAIVKSYIEHLINLPWNKASKLSVDLNKAQKILNKDHYGLEKIKDRIIEFLAVQKRVQNNKSPILCFVGPPGVGKTSLGESIAKTVGRKYIRVALGGLHDEAEIRGHRKTYVGAMPGKILQSIIRSGVKNPLFLLDEIDKLGSHHKGDPASALLEVLDPEQNHSFVDNYTETPFDLSQVMFIATANSLNIPAPLRDRMEIITLSGYTEQEKLKIAEQYLLPKQIKNTGLKSSEISINSNTILSIIRYHTMESGVRDLDRKLNRICRKIVKQIDTSQFKSVIIKDDNLMEFLGPETNSFNYKINENKIGRVNGLAWTEVGGDILHIEVVSITGKGVIIRTGKLGDVMLESIQTAISLVRSRTKSLGIDDKFYETNDIHVHVPEAATPKDGPSAGIAMATAIASSLNHIPIKSDVAMTGEVTLYGDVLPIGGLKEKLLAALRGNIKTVIIPFKNIKDLEEIPVEVKEKLTIIPVSTIDEVIDIAFEYKPKLFISNNINPDDKKNINNNYSSHSVL